MPAPRVRAAIAALIAAPLVLTACASPEAGGDAATPAGETVTVGSAYGEVTVPKDPQRVAGISYDTPWQLMSLDVVPVATIDYSAWLDEYSDDQQAFIAQAQAVGSYGEINFEALTTTKPDLIIGDAYEVDEATYRRLSEIAPTVIVGGGVRGDWQSITEETATAVGRHDVWADSKATYETTRDEVKAKYGDVIAANRWISFSLGNQADEFSVQLPTGAVGNLIVNEMGLQYGDAVPLEDTDASGYASLSTERLGEVFTGVTAALTFAANDGTINPAITKIIDSNLFQSLDVATSGHVYGLQTSVTDYRTATAWIDELATKVLKPLAG